MNVLWDNYIFNQFGVRVIDAVRSQMDTETSAMVVIADSDQEVLFLSQYFKCYFNADEKFRCVFLNAENDLWESEISSSTSAATRPVIILDHVQWLSNETFRFALKHWIRKNRQSLYTAMILVLVSHEEKEIVAGLTHAGLSGDNIEADKLQRSHYAKFLNYLFSIDHTNQIAMHDATCDMLYKTTRGIASLSHLITHESIDLLKQTQDEVLTKDIVHYAMENISTDERKARAYTHPLPRVSIYPIAGLTALLKKMLSKDPLKAVLSAGGSQEKVCQILRRYFDLCMFFGSFVDDESMLTRLDSLYKIFDENNLERALREILEITLRL